MTTLTGKHVAGLFVGGFSIIIGVNIALAVNAVRTFPGLETANSYVASQEFDAKRIAQEALGWTVAADYDGERLSLDITGPDGRPAPVRDLVTHLGRPTEERDDRPLSVASGGSVPMQLEPGLWRLDVAAAAPDGTAYEKRVILRVAP
ncbi:nitrogen fixation protein FixH [Palleronia sediminis]|uniref:Nitrogen fixation protein FixH n=1 Tax=Palleronia sediminis TaxID=2547833 RepID=A0A4R6A9T1_9RHOB|nr:FixH family protein [Palleronia sediminis]TDL79655.1 nitrogen fixation protein FixH [Palleronia sediminis]